MIGAGLAYQLGVRAGDYVKLITGNGAETPFGQTLRQKDYHIGAVYSVDNTEFDGLIIFMPLDQAQLFFRYPDAVPKLELRVDDADDLDPLLPTIREAAAGFTIRDWRQTNASYYNALKVERGMVRIILLLIILIASP